MSVEVGRTGMAGVFVNVTILRAALNRKGHFACIALGIVFVGVQVLVEMGVAVPSGPVNMLVFMLMAMGMFVAVFHL